MEITQLEATSAIAGEAWSLWRPPPKLSLSEWADRYRILSSESSAEPGQWITAKAPYEKEIMNAISNPDCSRIAVQKASQMGITDCLLNAIGYFVDMDPCPLLMVQPTIELAEAFSTDRFRPMVRDTPKLRGLVAEPRARDSQNTLRRTSFKGGFLALGGANSAASLSGRSVRIAFLDEADRYPLSAGTEGNPVSLAIARTTMPARKKSLIVFAWKSQERVIVISLNWKMGNQCVGTMKHFLRDSKLNTGKSGTNLVSELTYGRSCQVSGTNRSTAEFWHWLL
jgi:phage terminase large subunit GpA-like protein